MDDAELSVLVADSPAEMESMRAFWQQHNRHPESALDFVNLLLRTRDQVLRPHVLMVRQGHTPLAMLIGRLERSALVVRLGYREGLRLPLTQWVFVRDGFLGECSERIAAALMAQLRSDLRSGVADRIVLSSLPVVGALHTSASWEFSVLQRDAGLRPAEHWLAHLPADFESFLARRSSKHRYAFRRTVRHFESLHPGQVRHRVFEQPHDVPALCEAAETVARSTYQRGLGAGFVDNAEHRQRLQLAAQRGALQGHVLFAGEQPVAFWVGELSGPVMYVAWTGFDPAFRRHEVGTIAFLGMLEHLMARGVRTIDFGPGGAAYKARFGDLCLHEQDVALYAMTPKALAARVLAGAVHCVNHLGRRVLERLAIANRLKKAWRDRLSSRARSQAQAGTPAEPAAVRGEPAVAIEEGRLQ